MGSFSSTRLIEQVANDVGNTLGSLPSRLASKVRGTEAVTGSAPEALDTSHRRLSERIASIKPATPVVAGDTIPPNQRIAIARPLPYRVSEATCLADLMRKPEPAAAPVSEPESSTGSEPAAAPAVASLATRLADAPVVSEANPFTTGSRLAALLREQRELLEDLARISVHIGPPADSQDSPEGEPSAAAAPAGESTPAEPPAVEMAQAAENERKPEAAATTTAEPANRGVPAASTGGAARSAEDIIKALAAVVETQPMPGEQKVDTEPKGDSLDGPALSEPRPELHDQTYTIAPMVHTTTLNRSSQLVHSPEPLGLASLIDEERPPMIIERAYTSLPGLDSDRDLLPRAPGFVAGMALSGIAGIALFFALRVT